MKYCIAVLLVLLSINAQAELHKWVDAAGNVHYSDTAPPADAQEQQVHIPLAPAVAASEAPAEKSIFEREADLEKALKAKKEAEQKAAQEKEKANNKKQNCENARNNLRTLENSSRITTYDASGNQVIMDDAARQKKIDEVRKTVSESCD